jgi:two-component system phosphate regulon sensor histidine kinase PhoR
MKRQLSELNHEYETLMKHCGTGVLVIDSTGVIQRVNATASRLFGVSEKTLVGRMLAPPVFPEELCVFIQDAQTQRTTLRGQVLLPEPGGGVAMVSVSPILGERRKHLRFLIIVRDVTELRRLETVRRDFVANVSHELRTPLASIRAMAETLQDGALEDAVLTDRFLATIITEAERLARVSNDLLILSDAESRAPEKAAFSLSSLVEEVVKRFQSQAEKARIGLTFAAPPGLEIVANADQIEAVLVNLIDNAIKYTPADGRVHVTAENLSGWVMVHVADTGIGIPRKHHTRIFERFYRVDKARSRQSGGTGLGLSIVKHMVEAHGGEVNVESESGNGTTFTVRLPAMSIPTE